MMNPQQEVPDRKTILTMQRTKQDIYALIEKGETFHLECKKAQGGLPSSLWESYSAFCNTDGGVILLGVKEEGGLLVVEGVEDDAALVKSFWDVVHNPEKVSSCVLTERDVQVVDCDGKNVVAIDVPRADRKGRPVHIGNNVFEGTYRRNGEGDYKCTRDSVESMIRDHCEETADACLMDELTAEDLNADTIRRYRSGHGLSNLFGVWKKSGFPEPMISESYDPDRTTIELKFEGVPKAGQVLTQNDAAGSVGSRQELDNNQTINRQEKLSDLSASVRRVFVELEHNPGFTQAGLVSKLGLSRATITTAIATLIKRGLLRRVGPKKGGHWEIVKPQPPTGGPGS